MLMYISTGLCEHFHVDSLEMTRQSIFLRFFFPFQLAVFPSNIFFSDFPLLRILFLLQTHRPAGSGSNYLR